MTGTDASRQGSAQTLNVKHFSKEDNAIANANANASASASASANPNANRLSPNIQSQPKQSVQQKQHQQRSRVSPTLPSSSPDTAKQSQQLLQSQQDSKSPSLFVSNVHTSNSAKQSNNNEHAAQSHDPQADAHTQAGPSQPAPTTAPSNSAQPVQTANPQRASDANFFAGLEEFGIDESADVQSDDPVTSSYAVDDDGMDNMIRELAQDDNQFPSTSDADWQFENIGVHDFYTAENTYPNLPLNFMDTTGSASVSRQTPQTDLQVTLQGRATTSKSGSPSGAPAGSAPDGAHGAQQSNAPQTVPQRRSDMKMSRKVGRPKPSALVPGSGAPVPGGPSAWHQQSTRPNAQQNSPHMEARSLAEQQPPTTPVVDARPAQTRAAASGSASRLRSPGSSTSSAPSRGRAPTAVCPACGKSIATNGANFRRHQEACRRQRADRPTGNAPSSSPALASSPLPGGSSGEPPGGSSPARHMKTPDVGTGEASRSPFEAYPSSAHAQAASQRRDSDLLQVVRRLEASISTLDVSARLCLRDALVSLSNKASNPHMAPTPEQEAMNRAAEYLVLRMLFLSGQQVMHTAPGTAGTYATATPPNMPPHPQSAVPSFDAGGANVDDMQRHGGSSAAAAGLGPVSRNADDTDDGTIAASTGGSAVPVVKSEKVVSNEPPPTIPKTEGTGGET